MASALPPANNQQITAYMENSSKNYFSQPFLNSNISIQRKPKAGKQGGHVVLIKPGNTTDNSTTTKTKRFYVKPQDNFVLPWISSAASRLADVEELFVYHFLYNFYIGPLVHLYVKEEKPQCLLIATAAANAMTDEEFYTAACCTRAGLESITVENVIFIRVIEFIFCLKDLLTNENNYGCLSRTNRLMIIDFSIDHNQISNANVTRASNLIFTKLPKFGCLALSKLSQQYDGGKSFAKKLTIREVMEPSIDSLPPAIDIAKESIDNFISSYPFAFNDRTKEMTHPRLQQFADRSRGRFNELVAFLSIRQE